MLHLLVAAMKSMAAPSPSPSFVQIVPDEDGSPPEIFYIDESPAKWPHDRRKHDFTHQYGNLPATE